MGTFALLKRRGAVSLGHRNVLLRNVLWLTLQRASTYLIPLVLTPYLARVLGVEQYGMLGVAASIIANLTIFTDWGFSLSATREVARNAADPLALRRIFWDTLAAKALLVLASFALVVTIVACLGFSSRLSWIILGGYLAVLGNAGAAGWFLLGLQAAPSMVAGSLIGQLLVIPLTFYFVRGPEDTVLASVVAACGGFVSVAINLYVALRLRPLMPVSFTLSGAWRQLCDGWHVFASMAAISLYTQFNVIAVGALAGSAQAGLLFGAQKLANACRSAIGPLATAAYPRVSGLVADRPGDAVRLATRVLVVQGVITFGLFIFLLLAAPLVISLFLGVNYEGAIPAVRWLSATVFFAGISNALGAQFLLPFGMQRVFMRIFIAAGLFNAAAIAPCSYYFGATGASISMVATEFTVAALMGLVVWHERTGLALRPAPTPPWDSAKE